MTIDTLLNVIIFATRMIGLLFSFLLTFNLIADARNTIQEERKNGLWATRMAILAIIGALFLENVLYGLSYLHGSFTTVGLNEWLVEVKPLLILTRILVTYGIIKLFLLFCCNKQKKG